MPESGATESLTAASLSDVGRTRKENQDACGEFRNSLGERLLVTADGMGGHTGGATASRMCIESIGREFNTVEGTPDERLRRGFHAANEAVHGYAKENPELTGMGTTGVAFLFTNDHDCWLAWVGDSRAYRFRDGQLVALSDDHSVVGEWVRNGVISEEEAEVHPRRNELMRAIGPEADVQVDVREVDILPGDRFLLCSDGLCGYLKGPEIAAILGFEQPEVAVRKLVDKVNEEHNSPDNVTVQIIEVPASFGGADAAVAAGPDANTAEGSDRSSAATTKEIDTTTLSEVSMDEDDDDDELPEHFEFPDEVEKESNDLPLILTGAVVVALLLIFAGYYACTIGGGGVPVKQEVEPAGGGVGVVEPAVDEKSALAQDAALRAAERRQRIEADRLAQETRRAEREKLRAESGGLSPPAVSAAPSAGAASAASAARAESLDSISGPILDLAIQAFLEDWARAAQNGDYRLYSSLGHSESEQEFQRTYGSHQDVEVRFDGVSHRSWAGGFVAVRADEVVTYRDEGGTHTNQITREFVLRQSPQGLRYAGSRD